MIPWLAKIVPFRLVLTAIVFLVLTGIGLRVFPRFKSAYWGISEMTHVGVGWVFAAAFLLYLCHHLFAQWGTLRSMQRIHGVVLALSSGYLLITGAMLAVGRLGGFPEFVKESHYAVTWVFIALLVVHSSVGLRRRFSRRLVLFSRTKQSESVR